MTTEYGKPSYWNKRYKKDPETFDWYQKYSSLKPFLVNKIDSKDAKILMVGCGNSTLSEDMYNDGYKNITNIDISSVVIEQCKEKYKESLYPGMLYQIDDVLDLTFDDESFDVVIDKGTFDTIMCGDCSKAILMCEEIYRVLNKKGVYIVITYGKPNDREFYFDQACDWSILTEKIEKTDDEYKETDDEDDEDDKDENSTLSNSKKKQYHYIYSMKKDQ